MTHYTSLYDYALGFSCYAGIACISGDAAGFDSFKKPLTKTQLAEVIRSCLEQDIENGIEQAGYLLEVFKEDNVYLAIAEIHAEYMALFCEFERAQSN